MYNIPKHFKIDSETIFSDKVNSHTIIQPLWFSVNIYGGYDKYKSDLSRFTVPQKYVFAIQWYIAEVENGGHDQFFFNSTGIVWQDALEGMKEIGLEDMYSILKRAADILGSNPPFDREKRWKIMDNSDTDGFRELDSRVFALDMGEIENRLMDYIRDHADDFICEVNL